MEAPHHTPADTPFVSTLLKCYEQFTGQKGECLAIGGGTYARAFPNCVCFGSVYPTEELTVHSPNERTRKANIIQNTVMYGFALHELTN